MQEMFQLHAGVPETGNLGKFENRQKTVYKLSLLLRGLRLQGDKTEKK